MSTEAKRPIRYFSIETIKDGLELTLALAEFADIVLIQDGRQTLVLMSIEAFEKREATAPSPTTPGDDHDAA